MTARVHTTLVLRLKLKLWENPHDLLVFFRLYFVIAENSLCIFYHVLFSMINIYGIDGKKNSPSRATADSDARPQNPAPTQQIALFLGSSPIRRRCGAAGLYASPSEPP
jgi:hypothetical protein